MAAYTVSVGSFEGPFDLLLQLIARHKLDIHEIPLAEITDDYLVVLRTMDAVDLDTTTEFLVVAATLVELKAARLLPADDADDLDEIELSARDLLYARLLEYRTFRQASAWIGDRLEVLGGYIPRTAGPDPAFRQLRVPLRLDATPDDLARMAAHALAEEPDPVVDVSHLQPVRMTVAEAADLVMDELARAGGRTTFRELTAGCRHRIEVIVCFLAVLELYKFDHVDVGQGTTFGELTVTATDVQRWHTTGMAGARLVTSVDAPPATDAEPATDADTATDADPGAVEDHPATRALRRA